MRVRDKDQRYCTRSEFSQPFRWQHAKTAGVVLCSGSPISFLGTGYGWLVTSMTGRSHMYFLAFRGFWTIAIISHKVWVLSSNLNKGPFYQKYIYQNTSPPFRQSLFVLLAHRRPGKNCRISKAQEQISSSSCLQNKKYDERKFNWRLNVFFHYSYKILLPPFHNFCRGFSWTQTTTRIMEWREYFIENTEHCV
jgi:hypothetical protein